MTSSTRSGFSIATACRGGGARSVEGVDPGQDRLPPGAVTGPGPPAIPFARDRVYPLGEPAAGHDGQARFFGTTEEMKRSDDPILCQFLELDELVLPR